MHPDWSGIGQPGLRFVLFVPSILLDEPIKGTENPNMYKFSLQKYQYVENTVQINAPRGLFLRATGGRL